jgi:hypothetical protein
MGAGIAERRKDFDVVLRSEVRVASSESKDGKRVTARQRQQNYSAL